jgi:hypothetical protein
MKVVSATVLAAMLVVAVTATAQAQRYYYNGYGYYYGYSADKTSRDALDTCAQC